MVTGEILLMAPTYINVGESKINEVKYQVVEQDSEDDSEEINDIGFIEINGMMAMNVSLFDSLFGYRVKITDVESAVMEAKDNCKHLVFHITSAGSTLKGIMELASLVNNLEIKTTAFVDDCCCSGAYLLASACDEIIATPSATVGSIGVMANVFKNEQTDRKCYLFFKGEGKAYGSPDLTISEEEKKYFTDAINNEYENFASAVCIMRGYSREFVDGLQSLSYSAKDKKELVDKIMTRQQFENYIMKGIQS